MKTLLFGSTGQVGWELHRALAPLGEVTVVERGQADFSAPETLGDIVLAERPDVIVNAVAHTAVDRAESEPELALAINATAPGELARAARETGSLLVHYSTDYVFDGMSSRSYREDEASNPQSVYGRTKHAGEEAIREAGCRHLIFRTSWVHAARGRNFVRTILRLARERETLDVVNDQYGAPTGAELIADVTALALRAVPDTLPAHGIYHLTASGRTSWCAFAAFIVREANLCGLPTRLAPDAIVPIPTSGYPVPAPRPANSVLDCTRLEAALGIIMPDWAHHARRTVREVVEGVRA